MQPETLLTTSQMGEADRLTIAMGTPGHVLMERAGRGVAELILRTYAARPAMVLCGPGNNGGDGFVVARRLKAAGWNIAVALLGAQKDLKGDAALMASRWDGDIARLDPSCLEGIGLVVDAMFGAGLGRAIDGVVAATIVRLNDMNIPVIAVDIPSGIDGNSGAVQGVAVRASHTVTFFTRKPGHLLLPGRDHCGRVEVVDIGIKPAVLPTIGARLWANSPACWRADMPKAARAGHKYARGHAVVRSGGLAQSGAARLAAMGALRAGAGLVTIAAPTSALPGHAGVHDALMLSACDNWSAFRALIDDPRKNAVLVGPGNGTDTETHGAVMAALGAQKACVIDADGLTVFAEAPNDLFHAIRSPCVLTPHDGEFRRLFDTTGDKLSRVRRAAAKAGAVVLLKGADTVIAAPDGRAVINDNAPADLATAGSGDVLAGVILGLLAQGMLAFEAAAAGVWLLGAAGSVAGRGLIASDLPGQVPKILRSLA